MTTTTTTTTSISYLTPADIKDEYKLFTTWISEYSGGGHGQQRKRSKHAKKIRHISPGFRNGLARSYCKKSSKRIFDSDWEAGQKQDLIQFENVCLLCLQALI